MGRDHAAVAIEWTQSLVADLRTVAGEICAACCRALPSGHGLDRRSRSTYLWRPYAAWTPSTKFARVSARWRGLGLPASVRVTLQRANFRQLPAFVDLAKAIGARQVSFLAVDIASSGAFGRTGTFSDAMALHDEDVPALLTIIDAMEQNYAADFESGFIAESPQKLRRNRSVFLRLARQERLPSGTLQCARIFGR